MFDKHGRDWKTISEMIDGRTHQQVRTHAQKYHSALTKLGTDVQNAVHNSQDLNSDFYLRLNKYLSEKCALLKSDTEMSSKMFPDFIISKVRLGQAPVISFAEQMRQVALAIKFEVNQ